MHFFSFLHQNCFGKSARKVFWSPPELISDPQFEKQCFRELGGEVKLKEVTAVSGVDSAQCFEYD